MKAIQLIENNSEIGAGTRGASLGIEALKVASLNAKSDYFSARKIQEVPTHNELLFEENATPTAIRIQGIRKVYEAVADVVSKSLSEDKFPLILAADHASAGGTIAGIKKQYPNKTLGVVWIDAHGDLHSPYTSPTGNVHGMPLATALNEDNFPCQIKEVDAESAENWNALKNTGGIAPKIEAENLVFFGVRDTEEPEDAIIERMGIKNFTVSECREKGITAAANEAIEMLDNCDIIYISFDVDSMDPDIVSYGTGTPVADGFSPDEANQLIQDLFKSNKVICFEMVEINPTLDNKQNYMADTAFKILVDTTQTIEQNSLS